MYNGVKSTVPAALAMSGFHFGWLMLAAATLLFAGMSLKSLAKPRGSLRP